ncbi:MAG: ribosome small subunit-dependent GTPase A [Candidatus Cloacimonadota bacterium]|nr:ribosome small subunit-dependent GTPase A [Candidatus Cloacimonadota bacterium]
MKKKNRKKMKRMNVKYSNVNLDILDDLEIDNDKYKYMKQKKKIINHKDSYKAKVIEVFSNNRATIFYNNKEKLAYIKGNLKQFSSGSYNLLAVGDFVECITEGDKAIIVNIDNRENALERIMEDKKIIIAANIDQVIITTSYVEPEISFGLIDRYICSSRILDIKPIICINKIDKCDDRYKLKSQLDFYKQAGIKVIYTSAETGEGIEILRKLLIDKESVFSGFSGVGKSSIINKLQSNINLHTAEISDYTKKGRHTTTSSRMIPWDFGGYLIDTPGIKIFGIDSEKKNKIREVFPHFDKYNCKFNDCSHTHEDDCAVKNAVENNKIPQERYNSYLRIIESMEQK